MLALALFALTGCGDQNSAMLNELKDRNSTNVARVSSLYKLYTYRHNSKGPDDREELIAFVNSGDVDKNLERIGVPKENPENLFISERDGQPLKVRWGLKIRPDEVTPIAFESVGVDGVRLVAADTVLEVATDEEYDKLWEGEYVSESDRLKAALGEEAGY